MEKQRSPLPALRSLLSAPGFRDWEPPRPIFQWHVVISGHLQHGGHASDVEPLWRNLRDAVGNGSVCVDLCEWNRRWDQYAEFIWRFQHPTAPPTIRVYAYSWGAGWGFLKLARELKRRGLRIETAVLSDAVYCSGWWLLKYPQALSPIRRVVVPDNVGQVHWFFQRSYRPYGHKVVAADPAKTRIHPGVEAACDHYRMDRLIDFHQLAMHVAES